MGNRQLWLSAVVATKIGWQRHSHFPEKKIHFLRVQFFAMARGRGKARILNQGNRQQPRQHSEDSSKTLRTHHRVPTSHKPTHPSEESDSDSDSESAWDNISVGPGALYELAEASDDEDCEGDADVAEWDLEDEGFHDKMVEMVLQDDDEGDQDWVPQRIENKRKQRKLNKKGLPLAVIILSIG
jgi:hypothetical protein